MIEIRWSADAVLRARTYQVPKRGHRADENEDALAVEAAPGRPLRTAIADGATESAYSGLWARLLVRALTAPEGRDVVDAAARSRSEWERHVRGEAASRPWYVAEKVEEGAHAAVLRLTLRPDRTWAAEAVGDCCLFHVRDGAVLRSWPFEEAAAFDHHPRLVATRTDLPVVMPDAVEGTWTPGDVFWLATDALAAWLMRHTPFARGDWTEDEFRDLVRDARDAGTLRNDDVTLAVIETSPGDGTL